MDLLTVVTFVVSMFAVAWLTAWAAITAVSDALRKGRRTLGARLTDYPEQLAGADALAGRH